MCVDLVVCKMVRFVKFIFEFLSETIFIFVSLPYITSAKENLEFSSQVSLRYEEKLF